MQFDELFYSVSWVSFILIVWFYTDTLFYYTQLLGIWDETRYKYGAYISQNPNKFFPDFLYKQSLEQHNRCIKFSYKLLSCPFCIGFWLSLLASFMCSSLLLTAPIYVVSMLVVLGIKKLL